MHRCQKMMMTIAFLGAASLSIGQERYRSPDPDVMARLSYDNSGIVEEGSVRHICIAVSRDGEYRIVRSTDTGETERLQGKMQKEELSQLSKLLGAAEFRNLSGSHGGLVRQGGETFGAEIPIPSASHSDTAPEGSETAWRLHWLNGDSGNPFPAPVSRIVGWVKRFQPVDGRSFEHADYPDVCPTVGLRFVQPSVAGNAHR